MTRKQPTGPSFGAMMGGTTQAAWEAAHQYNQEFLSGMSHASEQIIEQNDRPEPTPVQAPAPTGRPASDKQRSFVESLLAQRDLTGTKYEGWTPDWSRATSKSASAVIEYLLTLPRKTAQSASSATEEPEAGVYTDGDQMIRVYLGQNSGKMLAKRVQVESGEYVYEYLGQAVRFITAQFRRMTLAEIGALGHKTGNCAHCGRRLDDPESVDLGIGPVCAKRYSA